MVVVVRVVVVAAAVVVLDVVLSLADTVGTAVFECDRAGVPVEIVAEQAVISR
jgi:hypothetical protein